METGSKTETHGRDVALDVARGIAILLVVAGHVFTGPSKAIIYTFHMPFFFFIGGYFFTPRDNLTTLKKSFKKLIIPYCAFLAVFSIPELVSSIENNGFDDVAWRIRKLFLGGGTLTAPFTIFWFPTCYFFTIVIYNFVTNRFSNSVVWKTCIALAVLATFAQFVFPDFWLPWALNTCAMSIPMFHIGAVFGRSIFRPGYLYVVAALAVSVAYGVAIVLANAPPMGMKGANYGIPVLTLLASICMTSVLAALSRLLSRSILLPDILSYFSGASMTIMYIHMPVKMLLLGAGVLNTWVQFVLAFGLSLACHWVFSLFSISRVVFLGERAQIRFRRPS